MTNEAGFAPGIVRFAVLQQAHWQHGVKPLDRLPDLAGGDPGIPLGHAQIAVAKLAGDHVQLHAVSAQPGAEGVAQIVEPDVLNAERLAGAVESHADRAFRDAGEEQIIWTARWQGRQHLLGKAVQVNLFGIVVFAGGQQDAGAFDPAPAAAQQFTAAHPRGREQREDRLHWLRRGGQQPPELAWAEVLAAFIVNARRGHIKGGVGEPRQIAPFAARQPE